MSIHKKLIGRALIMLLPFFVSCNLTKKSISTQEKIEYKDTSVILPALVDSFLLYNLCKDSTYINSNGSELSIIHDTLNSVKVIYKKAEGVIKFDSVIVYKTIYKTEKKVIVENHCKNKWHDFSVKYTFISFIFILILIIIKAYFKS